MLRHLPSRRGLLTIGTWVGTGLSAAAVVWIATRNWMSDPIVLDVARVLAVVMLVPTWTVLIVQVRRSRRPKPGDCRCGYDLAGLFAGTVCPECGETAPPRP